MDGTADGRRYGEHDEQASNSGRQRTPRACRNLEQIRSTVSDRFGKSPDPQSGVYRSALCALGLLGQLDHLLLEEEGWQDHQQPADEQDPHNIAAN